MLTKVYFNPLMRKITAALAVQPCPQLTVSLPHLQQDGFLQHDGEGLVLLILLVIDDLHVQHLPVSEKGQGTGKGWSERRHSLIRFVLGNNISCHYELTSSRVLLSNQK